MTHRMTVDFEEWYQGLTSTGARPDTWGAYDRRIEIGAQWLLDLFAAQGIRATFFIVGRVAEDTPAVVRAIADAGHEIALHGNAHALVYTMTRETFRADVAANIAAVEKAAGVRPVGFRAPCFSLSKETPWVWEELAAQGIAFDSSLFPVKTPLYGLPDAERRPHVIATANGPVREYPMSVFELAGKSLPFSGGFYFRALPYTVTRALFRAAERRGEEVNFYIHPWEFDPAHPVAASVTPRERLSHYGFLKGAREKLTRLVEDFPFGPLGAAEVPDAD